MPKHIVKSDKPFIAGMFLLSGFYVVMIVLMVVADRAYLAKPVKDPAPVTDMAGVVALGAVENGHRTITITNTETKESRQYEIKAKYKPLYVSGENVAKGKKLIDREVSGMQAMRMTLASPEIQYSIKLSLVSCTASTILSLIVAIPIGYIMSRFEFFGKNAIDGILDIPIVLPPLVIGISLLVLFNYPPFSWTSDYVVYSIPGVIIAQFMVACAFAVRTMRVTFNRIPERFENVAMSLGCNRFQAFWLVVLPQARYGVIAAATLAWARALGEFGPILVFAGSTRMKTEVLPTSVYLELQAGSLKGVLTVAVIMIVIAAAVLMIARIFGMKKGDVA